MDTAEIFVTLAGVGLAAFVLWYFFLAARQPVRAASSSSGVQQVDITVQSGYAPDVIEVECGTPVRLSFYRDEENSCSEELLLPAFRIRRDLPAFQTTHIDLLPDKPGRYEFTCGMGMLRGHLVVK
ncbi:hypothetical protein GCM10027048_19950 [Hymenobacter coalescens]